MPIRRRRKTAKATRHDRDGIADLYEGDSSDRMIVVVASDEAVHDCGSFAVAIARRWAAHGREVLLVDADASGSALARRLGEMNRSTFSPAERGLPSLMAARQPLTAKLLRDHCWRLDTAGTGDVWLLLGPTSTSGAQLTATWLADSAAGLLAANAGRSMIVSMTHPLARGHEEFLRTASAVVLIAPVDTDERFEALCALGNSLGDVTDRCSPCLVTDGSSARSYEEIRTASGVHVAGNLNDISEQVLLRSRTRRRDSKPARLVDELAARIAFLAGDDEPDKPEREVSELRHGTAARNAGAVDPNQETADGRATPEGVPNGRGPAVRVDR